MDDQAALVQLEGLARALGITVRYEKITDDDPASMGGLCRLKGECVIIVHSGGSLRDKIQTLVKALRNFELDNVYLRPAIRELLEE